MFLLLIYIHMYVVIVNFTVYKKAVKNRFILFILTATYNVPRFNIKSAGSAVTSGIFRLCYTVRISYLSLPGTQGTVEKPIIAAVQPAVFCASGANPS